MGSNARAVFPVETRQVVGADKGQYAPHIIAKCCKCDATEAIKVSTRCGSVPDAMGQRLMRNRNWAPGTSRAKDLCPDHAGVDRKVGAPTPVPTEAVKPVIQIPATPQAPRRPQTGRQERVFRQTPTPATGSLGEKLMDAIRAKQGDATADLKSKVAELSPEEKARRAAVTTGVRSPSVREAERQEELRKIVDAQIREDGRVRRTGKTAPIAMPSNFRPSPPKTPAPVVVAAKPIEPPKPLTVSKAPSMPLILLEGGITLAPVAAPEPAPQVPMVVVTQVETVEDAPKVKTKRVLKNTAGRDAYWQSERADAQKAAMKLGRESKAAAKRGVSVDVYRAMVIEEDAARAARVAARDQKRAERDARQAERLRADPMLAQPELDLNPAVVTAPTPEPEVAPATPVEAIKETPMTDPTTKPTPQIADLTAPQRKIIRDVLMDEYDEDKACWRGDLSDNKVAERIKVARVYVTLMRDAMGLGEDVNEEAGEIARQIAALKAEMEKDKASDLDLLPKFEAATTQAEARAADVIKDARAKADEQIEQARRIMQRDIKLASDAFERSLAERETQRAEALRRLGDLIEKSSKARR